MDKLGLKSLLKIMRLIVSYLTLCLVTAYLAAGIAYGGSVPTTNSIPTDVFLTDNGLLFRYRPSGERVVSSIAIQKAKELPECRPAEEDPDGHWGQATDGFQLSLRFQKMAFTNGESIVAIMLMRNVTNKTQSYFRPTWVMASKDGKVLKPKNDTGLIHITMLPVTDIFPQTQQMYRENLNQSYDLSGNGEYVFQAACKNPAVFSQPVTVLITNGIQ